MRALLWLAFACVFKGTLLPLVFACNGVCYDTNGGLGPNNSSQYKCVSAVTKCYDFNQSCGGVWGASETGNSAGVWGWNASGTGPSGTLNMFGYIGAYPDGLPPPTLSTIPGTINYLLLAFLNTDTIIGVVPDTTQTLYSTITGNFVDPIWGTEGVLTPENIQANLQQFPGRRIVLSFGGDGLMWYDPVNVTEWINNAYNSLTPILNKYSATGLDVNVEHWANNQTFVECMGGLIKLFYAQNPNFIVTLTPWYTTWSYFQPLYNTYREYIFMVLYQFYANDDLTATANANLWKNVLPQINVTQLAFGLCNDVGLQLPEVGALIPLLENFHFNWMMWSVEFDFAQNYLLTTVVASQC